MRVFLTINRRYPALRAAAPILAALPPETLALLGDNPGAEQLLILALYTHNPAIHQRVYHADWNNHHTHARSIRDQAILEDTDHIIAFTSGLDHFDGPDRYLQAIIRQAIAQPIPLTLYDRWAQLVPPQPNLFDLADSADPSPNLFVCRDRG